MDPQAAWDELIAAYLVGDFGRAGEFAEALIGTGSTLVGLAESHIQTLMPDYTYLQQAQPTTLGHYLLGFAYPVLRDLDRVGACYGRTNMSPAGVGGVNGTRWPIDRDRLAALLGFDGLTTHARDAMWQADQPLEVMSVVTAALLNLDRLAEDLQVWVTSEFDLIELSERHVRGSMVMPQKKNPYALAFVRGVASATIGRLAGAATLGRWLLRWRGLEVSRRDVLYLVLLSAAVNVGVFLGLAWLEPVTTLPPALSGREVVLALAGFLGLVAIVASLVAGSILRSHPAPPAPTAPQDSPPA